MIKDYFFETPIGISSHRGRFTIEDCRGKNFIFIFNLSSAHQFTCRAQFTQILRHGFFFRKSQNRKLGC